MSTENNEISDNITDFPTNYTTFEKLVIVKEMRRLLEQGLIYVKGFCSAFYYATNPNREREYPVEMESILMKAIPELKPPQHRYDESWWYDYNDTITRLNILTALVFEYEDVLIRHNQSIVTDFTRFKLSDLPNSNSNTNSNS